jgi:hypothetical protein
MPNVRTRVILWLKPDYIKKMFPVRPVCSNKYRFRRAIYPIDDRVFEPICGPLTIDIDPALKATAQCIEPARA